MPHSHAHDNIHHHGQDEEPSVTRLFLTIILNFIITIAEIIGGIVSGSLSLISDALHNFSDGIAIIISYIAIKLNQQEQTEKYTFGLKRAEILAAVFNAGTLMAISVYLFKEAYHRFITPEPIKGGIMIMVASTGLLANIVGTLLLHRDSKKSINIRSAYLHLLSDVFSSIAVIIGGLAIYFWKIYWIDPLLTVLISVYVLWQSLGILRETLNILMMGTPKTISLDDIKYELESIPGILNIHHVHVWGLNERNIHFESHVEVEDIKVSETTRLSKIIEEKLKLSHQISHVTVQFECDKCKTQKLF